MSAVRRATSRKAREVAHAPIFLRSASDLPHYARHLAITRVMSSCWSLPLANCWTAATTV